MKNYCFAKTAIIRTPIGVRQVDLSWERIQSIFAQNKNREALFLGSPNVYNALVAWEKGEVHPNKKELKKLQSTLYKYASRLSNRCTPFGMFATVAAVPIAQHTALNIANSTLGRFTKYDMYFLEQLLPIVTHNSTVRAALYYYPNSSLYTVLDKYRYVEYYFKNNTRFHRITEVNITHYLSLIVSNSKKGILIHDLVLLLVCNEITQNEALAFINTLIDSQFLVSELELTITGQDYLQKLEATFSQNRFQFYEAQAVKQLITALQQKTQQLDEKGINQICSYQDIHQWIDHKINNVDIAKLFQVDSYRKINNGSLGFKTLKCLRTAITALNKLQSKQENKTLETFKKKFYERYEEYEQPLVMVLDPDIGIGYGVHSTIKTPLVDELLINKDYNHEKQITFDDKKTFLFQKVIQSLKEGTTAINLTNQEINTFQENEDLYPNTFSVLCSVFTQEGKEKIHLKSVSGPSANVLIGRFAHLDTDILKLCKEMVYIENQLYPNAIIAEIVHLPQARTGNILYRNFQRSYEIPYLGNASVSQEHQIDINDLYISIQKGNVVLRSKRLGKQIIPRLSNAHNYGINPLPIYHFLCDIQHQKTSGFAFNWGGLAHHFDFLPRVSYQDVVFARATWNINKTTIDNLTANNEANAIQAVRDFIAQKNIPNLVCITQGDNEVLFNFENDLSCEVFFGMLKETKFVQLTEFLFTENPITGHYCNEMVVCAHKNIPKSKTVEKENNLFIKNNSNIIPKFSIGQKWLYYKLYCGERVAETLLSEAILPIINELQAKGLIEKWFFIRYNDKSGSHLRFRILLNHDHLLANCIQIIKNHIEPFEQTQMVWKVQTDTYLRELQRYGYETIANTETLFNNDSWCTLQFINMIKNDADEKLRWLFSLLSIDYLLNDLGFSLQEKIALMSVAKTSFGKEFNRSGDLNKQINEMFAKSEYEIESFLDPKKIQENYKPFWAILQERSASNQLPIQNILQLLQQNDVGSKLQDITMSHIHMICNRIFLSKHRMHEMVVYDYLYKYYNKLLFK